MLIWNKKRNRFRALLANCKNSCKNIKSPAKSIPNHENNNMNKKLIN